MKTIEPHSLLTNKAKTIEIGGGVITDLFQIWKSLMKDKKDLNEFDVFVAGYFLGTNATLREKYMKLKPKDDFNLKINWEVDKCQTEKRLLK